MVSPGAVAAGGAARLTARAVRTRLIFAIPFVFAGVAALFLVPRAAASPRPQVTGTDVRQIFLADCATCHGADAKGTNRGPSLVGVGRASLDYYLTTGRMPITDPNLFLGNPDQEIKRQPPAYPPATISALEDYIQLLTGPGGPRIPDMNPLANRAAGGEVFRLQCAACHAWDGDGGALLHREAPQLHDATATQVGEAVRVGPGLMPAFGHAAIDDRQLDQLAAYVRYLAHPEDRGGNPLWHLGPFAEGFVAWAIAMTFLLLTIRWIGERK
ncbi:MAG TPA: c-type cytochrome [Acidimicrobiales bacterium]|jgi:ubiquinol-cytochrome c reductase cytochrome c subunit|nr:c-type cytochrome [Acidimicrobiales bacterium]